MDEHYVCTGGCKGTSDKPGVCQAVYCAKHGQPLEKCECTDGTHADKVEKTEDKNEGN